MSYFVKFYIRSRGATFYIRTTKP